MDTNKLCLGTVQFGLEYGLNNEFGKPSKKEVFEILDLARDYGIKVFDTASAYGNAEERIGEYINSRKCKNEIKIISKLSPKLSTNGFENPIETIKEEVEESLKRLNINFLDGFLLHKPADFYNQEVITGLINCKEKNLVKNIGVSIYEVEHALDVVSSEVIDYIQVPYNIFDQRVAKTDFFEIAHKNNVTVFARSPFLQGLILMNKNEVPSNLSIAKKYLDKLDKIISKYEISRVEAAMLFSYKNPNIDYVVFGVDNKLQLKEDIKSLDKRINSENLIEEIKFEFDDVEKSIVIPSLWA